MPPPEKPFRTRAGLLRSWTLTCPWFHGEQETSWADWVPPFRAASPSPQLMEGLDSSASGGSGRPALSRTFQSHLIPWALWKVLGT